MQGHNGGPELEDEKEQHFGPNGWIAVGRDMRWHPVVGFGKTVQPHDESRGSFSRSEAWTDLIMECRYSEGTVLNKGRRMTIKPGELVGAISWLADRWNWSPKTVRWFLDKLENEGMISRENPNYAGVQIIENEGNSSGNYKGNQSSIVSICKYAVYQLGKNFERQPKRQPERLPVSQVRATEGQHIKIETKEQGNLTIGTQPDERLSAILAEANATRAKPARRKVDYSDEFEGFWSQYPVVKNTNKQDAYKSWRGLSVDERQLAVGGLYYLKKHCKDNPTYTCLHPVTYLNQRRWETLIPAKTPVDAKGRGWWQNPTAVAAATPARWRDGIAKHANGFWDVGYLGPPPGDPKCLIPRALIEELQLEKTYTEKGFRRESND